MPDLDFEKITLNAIPDGEMPVFHASQFETMRPFIADLKWGTEDFAPGDGCWCTLAIRKTDDTLVIIDDIDIITNTVGCILTQQSVACIGDNFCQLKVWSTEDDEEKCIACLNFILHVQPDPEAGGITSESEINNLTEQIEKITQQVIGDDYYDKTEVDDLLDDKADKLDTYTKTQVDNALALKANAADLATVATTGDYDDLLNKPVIPAAQVQSDWEQADNTQVDYIKNKPDIDAMIADALFAVMPVGTTSGPIASFDTELAVPLVNVSCDIVATGGNGTPDNPVAINGYTEANITRCGVNLFDCDSKVSGTRAEVIYTSDDNYIYVNGTKNGGTYAIFSDALYSLKKGTYFAKAFFISGTATNDPQLSFILPDGSATGNIVNGATFTLSEDSTIYPRFAIWSDNTVFSNLKIGIVISTASISEYSTYNGNTYTVNFGQTVYGGVLDVTRGKLTVTHTTIEMPSTLNFTYDNTAKRWQAVISGMKSYPTRSADLMAEEWQADTTAAAGSESKMFTVGGACYFYTADNVNQPHGKLVYPLATPFDIDLTPEVISAIVGTNNVYSDTNGDTTVSYKDSIQHYIDQRT